MDTAKIFQERKQQVESLLKNIIIYTVLANVLLLGGVYWWSNEDASAVSQLIPIVGGSIFAIVISMIVIIRKSYRCPVCNIIPQSRTGTDGGGVHMNPLTCSGCGAKLK